MVGQRSLFGAPSPRAALGLLASPGCGLLVYSPLLLLAPLSRKAGGYGICRLGPDPGATKPRPVFRDVTDPDYQVLLTAILLTSQRLEEIKRFDMPGFRPHQAYVREMKRFGILPATATADRVGRR